jgi:hypothetical protein
VENKFHENLGEKVGILGGKRKENKCFFYIF